MRFFSAMMLLLCSVCGTIVPTPRQRTGKDEAAMVLIPEGTFVRGSAEGQAEADDRPQRAIHLRAF